MKVQVIKYSIQPFLEKDLNDENRKFILVFHKPHRKGSSSPPAMALTLEYVVLVPSWAASISDPDPIDS